MTEYTHRLQKAERDAIGRPCDTCEGQIKDPWIAICPPTERRKEWWIGYYCCRQCGGSHFNP